MTNALGPRPCTPPHPHVLCQKEDIGALRDGATWGTQQPSKLTAAENAVALNQNDYGLVLDVKTMILRFRDSEIPIFHTSLPILAESRGGFG